ncbi:hypothetical protein F2Q69_00030639 [Brassica cretica]|uniref:Uncharacterized protein n=1 Tax=Brassica cretica TaxID=69181 RepID=A0A8S9S0J9_BRACR|nr:hypothetical protein F2Q69_00030639 [Brassica cretica]
MLTGRLNSSATLVQIQYNRQHVPRTGKASFSTVDSAILSWVMLKLQFGRERIDLVHGPISLSGPIGRLNLVALFRTF